MNKTWIRKSFLVILGLVKPADEFCLCSVEFNNLVSENQVRLIGIQGHVRYWHPCKALSRHLFKLNSKSIVISVWSTIIKTFLGQSLYLPFLPANVAMFHQCSVIVGACCTILYFLLWDSLFGTCSFLICFLLVSNKLMQHCFIIYKIDFWALRTWSMVWDMLRLWYCSFDMSRLLIQLSGCWRKEKWMQ